MLERKSSHTSSKETMFAIKQKKKKVLVKKRIRVALTLLEKLSNTDPEDNSVQI